MAQEEITINAAGKRVGRLASEVALILSGKDSVNYMPNKVGDKKVIITNASKLQITDKKKKQKTYIRYTGYFGGKKETTMEQLIARKGYGEVFRKAVYGMLPDNKLRSVKMNNLHITE